MGLFTAFVAASVNMFGCTSDVGLSTDVVYGTLISESKMNEIIVKYNMTDYIQTRGSETGYDNLKAIRSEEELNAVLDYISNNFSIGNPGQKYSDINEFSIPLLKTRSESIPSSVMISGSTQDGRVDVYLDTQTPAVLNSVFYNTGIWDAFMGYEHLGGSASGASYIFS